ncbi:MAG: SIMPL domain-containing protein [Acidimicrobiaceae bacterium]|nr:SIMPL domain-containing protein [Ilumatobacter sp.]MCB9380787.1 SIMPL domain-containing protein [Acidimicrobiaceae bacterium]MCO5331471.1 SIMPL domain-containing protein [Ilumatobacteraceae bacterium]
MSSVIVRGTATATVTPDRAELTLAISHLAPDAAAALDDVATRSQAMATMFAGHGLQPEDWTTDGVAVAEEYQWKKDTNVLVGHRATTALTVTVRDATLVGTLIRDAVTGVGAAVRQLAWRVDAGNPARQALLGDAARDARLRAEAYAAALGYRLGEVELVSETPIGPPPGPAPFMPQARAMMAAKADSSPEVATSGGVIELTADVHVQFVLLPA